jgi:hypothetical protein
MKNIKLSFFIDGTDSSEILVKIKEYFSQKYTIDDVIVFSKDPIISRMPKEYGILSTYHLTFYKGIIVFFTLEDYLSHENISLSKERYLFINDKTIKDIESINRSTIQNINMITMNEDKTIQLTKLPSTL